MKCSLLQAATALSLSSQWLDEDAAIDFLLTVSNEHLLIISGQC